MSGRALLIACVVVPVMVTPVLAGENPNAKLALHVVASYDFLDCVELAPAGCESINVDVSLEELADADGYCYVVLVAYDVDSITGVEFALEGAPSGRGAPALTWCEDAISLGDHEDGGGITAFEACVESDSTSGIATLAYWSFGPLDSTDLPINLSIIPSTYSDEDSVLYVMDCSVDHVIDDVVLASGCAIGAMYSGAQPECGGLDEGDSTGGGNDSEEQAQGGTGEGGMEDGGGLTVGSIDPDTAQGNQPIKVEITGDGFGFGTFFTLSREGDAIWADRWQLDGDDKVTCSFILAKADTGLWDVNAIAFGDTATLDDGFKVEGVVADEEAVFQAHRLTVAFQDEILNLGAKESATREGIEYMHPDVEALVDSFGVTSVEKLFKGSAKGDTLATARNGDIVRVEDLSGFHILHATESLDVLAAVRAFRALPDSLVVNADPSYIVPLADVANDRYLDGNGYSALQLQWGFWNVGQEGGKFDADIDATDAWSIETGSESVRAVVLDTGIRASHSEFAGKFFDTGPDYYYDDDEPDDVKGHGTACAGIIGALTNNKCPGEGSGCGSYTNGLVAGMAGGWGNYEGTGSLGTPMAAVKVCGDGDDDGCPNDAVAPGFDWARNHGASVVNHSIGSSNTTLALQTAIHNCAMEGIVVASSMGNCEVLRDCYQGTSGEADLSFVPGQDAGVNPILSGDFQRPLVIMPLASPRLPGSRSSVPS